MCNWETPILPKCKRDAIKDILRKNNIDFEEKVKKGRGAYILVKNINYNKLDKLNIFTIEGK
jgi:hypothetical protein